MANFSLSLSVWVGVAGMIAYYFNIITPITIVANLIVIPLVSLITILGFGLLMSSFLWAPLVSSFTVLLHFFLNMMVMLIFLFDQIPYAYFFIKDLNFWLVMSYYILGLSLIYRPWQLMQPFLNFIRYECIDKHRRE